ncbi:uncharacterized protein LOC131650791 [Vicia villosa]|uniref:uncharacterized protein LOC131650791 n=1 Tax=Vicia villosa TaxID=3911 RepID=UPI00273A7B1C|nr:uncharacterized protein LOC131650791 [Vicia villosa]
MEVFDCAAVEDIIHVPLLEEVTEDRLIWSEEQSGNYPVRSGYRLWRKAKKRQNVGEGEASWSNLWKISAAPRFKLLWRICKDFLPTRKRLRLHHVPCVEECPLCNLSIEDDWHIFFGCAESLISWRAAGLGPIIESRIQVVSDVRSVIFDICNSEDRKVAGRVAVMVEALWKNRNDMVWNNEKDEASRLGWLAFHRWQELFTTQQVLGNNNNLHHALTWSPPEEDWVKCNVDVGFNSLLGTTNRGWCIRGEGGSFIHAGVAWDSRHLSILEAEALALKEAIQDSIALHLDRIIFESDSLTVVMALHSNASGSSEFHHVIRSIRLLLSSFHNFEVKFVKRQANMVAHSLVKAANSWARRSSLHYILPCIALLINNEMN